jgi:hypothetical protein
VPHDYDAVYPVAEPDLPADSGSTGDRRLASNTLDFSQRTPASRALRDRVLDVLRIEIELGVVHDGRRRAGSPKASL